MPTPDRNITFKHRLPVSAAAWAALHPGGVPEAFWIEATYGDWVVAYRITQQGGRPVVAEMRVIPLDTGVRPPGEWSLDPAHVPDGGLPARMLRELLPGEDVTIGLRNSNRYVRLVPPAAERFKRAGFSRLRKRHVGGRAWPEDKLLAAAVFYVERRSAGRPPVADLAESWGMKYGQARDLLQSAKERGFLTAGTQGKASRVLTEKAKALLKRETRR